MRSQSIRKLIITVLVLTLEPAFNFVGKANAQSKEKPLMLEKIAVTATRNEKEVVDIPNTVNILTGEEMQHEKLPASVPEFLTDMPGVMVQKTSHGQGSPYIRGFTGFRNLFLIDGIRLNNSVFRDGPNQYWNTVDPFTIEKLEVTKGAGSVLYGSDAIGGVVNALTLSPKEYNKEKPISPRLYYRYANPENTNIGRMELNGSLGEKTGYVAGVSLKDFGDVYAGGDVDRQEKTGYDEFDGDVKIERLFGTDSRLVVAHQHVDQNDIWRTHTTSYGISWEGTTIGDEKKRILDQNRDLTYLQYHGNNISSYIDSLSLSLSFHVQEEEQYRIKADNTSDRQGFTVKTVGFSNQLETPSPFGNWIYGLEIYHDMVDSFLKKYKADGSPKAPEIQGPVADDATYDNLGILVQDEISVTPKLNFFLGGRYTYTKADADKIKNPVDGKQFSLTKSWDATVGSVKTVYHVDTDKHWNLFAGISQGFRAPNLSDLTRLDTARSNEFETPSPDLAPEKFVSTEIGLKTRYENLSTDVAYFYTFIDDMVIRTPTGNVIHDGSKDYNEVTKKNAGEGYINGLELGARYKLNPYISTFGVFTWMYGEVDTYPTSTTEKKKEPVDRLLPPSGNFGVRFDSPNKKYWIEAISSMAAKQDKLSTLDKKDTQRIPPGGTPGYCILSLRSGWEVKEHMYLSAAIENITDKDYRIHGSGVNEPGRNFIIALDVRF